MSKVRMLIVKVPSSVHCASEPEFCHTSRDVQFTLGTELKPGVQRATCGNSASAVAVRIGTCKTGYV